MTEPTFHEPGPTEGRGPVTPDAARTHTRGREPDSAVGWLVAAVGALSLLALLAYAVFLAVYAVTD